MTRRPAAWVVVVVLLMTVAGCTGVPRSSEPQVVRTVGLGESPPPSAPAPPTGASQAAIVRGFLNAVRTSPDRLDAARAYLDETGVQNWSAGAVTIVRTPYLVGTEDVDNNTVTVSYRAIGTLTPAGVYSPATAEGTGEVGTQSATYTLAKTNGQWRIHTPVPPGLFITEDDFAQLYNPRPLYFLDTTGTRLVPDLRYSALSEPSLETFLLSQLAAGPRDELRDAVAAFAPEPAGNARLSVTPGAPTIVQIPGSAALDDQAKVRLAAQVAFTLQRPTSFQSEVQIEDGPRVVTVPGIGDQFDYTRFTTYAPVDDTASTTATYLRDGAVVDSSGKPVNGPLGQGRYDLDTAVFDTDGGRTQVAGTTGTPGDTGRRRLLVGDTNELKDVRVPAGPLTAPVWAPVGTRDDPDEVWVASGSTVYRFVPGVRGARPTPVRLIGANIPGTIVSMAFSPEGTRLALVIRTDAATSQVSVAAVARNGQDVRLTGLTATPITPSDYQLSDVGWRTETALTAVGVSSSSVTGVYVDVYVDGSRLVPTAPDGLPSAARTIAVSPQSDVQWVGVSTGGDDTVWTKSSSARSWSPPTDGGSQRGTAPAFSR